MIRILNDMDIVPDLLTFGLRFDWGEVKSRYGRSVQANYRRIRMLPLPQDWAIIAHHTLLRRFGKDYDILIDTSNSLLLLPDMPHVMSYVFFPRKRRIEYDAVDIHSPGVPARVWTRAGLRKQVLRQIYRFSRPNPEHTLVCMTRFTLDAIQEVYPSLPDDLPLVYPAVELSHFWSDSYQKRQPNIVSIGRFSVNKRQLDQIKLAEHLPEKTCHIVGFISDQKYYRQCKRYIAAHDVKNVHLHPNLPFDDMIELLQRSKYFLHTLINEPFGITAVQAMAAGCLPLVHNSGGQRETVPIHRLRYTDLRDVPDLIHDLDALPQHEVDATLAQLQAHIRANYDEHIFYDRMAGILGDVLRQI